MTPSKVGKVTSKGVKRSRLESPGMKDFMLHVRASFHFESHVYIQQQSFPRTTCYGQAFSLHSTCVPKNRILQCCIKSVPNSTTQPHKPFKKPNHTNHIHHILCVPIFFPITCQLRHPTAPNVAKFHSLQGD